MSDKSMRLGQIPTFPFGESSGVTNSIVGGGGIYSYNHVLHNSAHNVLAKSIIREHLFIYTRILRNLFLVISIAFIVCKQECTNMFPPPIIDLPRDHSGGKMLHFGFRNIERFQSVLGD